MGETSGVSEMSETCSTGTSTCLSAGWCPHIKHPPSSSSSPSSSPPRSSVLAGCLSPQIEFQRGSSRVSLREIRCLNLPPSVSPHCAFSPLTPPSPFHPRTDTLRGSFPPHSARCARRHEAALGTLYTGERSSTEGIQQREHRSQDRGQGERWYF
ncbi:hypothetical protein PBY51_018612 [Eleginops maclovinus]|uniref:Uncharacterized protein n=1 Tax=Eleginops maclovinus TaxID=56733 RepID=A0AAN7YA67_ELEMC|nr:hypothetical protein PBY51_018612 [Eleginops maclovinus]